MMIRGDGVDVSDSGDVNENERESEILSESGRRRPKRRPRELLLMLMMMMMKERNCCRRRHHGQGAKTLRWWPVQHQPQRAVGQPWPLRSGKE